MNPNDPNQQSSGSTPLPDPSSLNPLSAPPEPMATPPMPVSPPTPSLDTQPTNPGSFSATSIPSSIPAFEPPPPTPMPTSPPAPTPPPAVETPPPISSSPDITQTPPTTLPTEGQNFNWSASPANNTSTTPSSNLEPHDLYGPSMGTPQVPESPATPAPQPPSPLEPAPTDLSHLVGTPDTSQPIYTPPMSQPETLVVPSAADTPVVPTEAVGGHGIPKWVIGVGVALLLAVVGASAYFILGIGKTPEPASQPATTQQAVPPALQPIGQSTPAATQPSQSPGNFGDLTGGAQPTQAASSAADLLKQRQGQ